MFKPAFSNLVMKGWPKAAGVKTPPPNFFASVSDFNKVIAASTTKMPVIRYMLPLQRSLAVTRPGLDPGWSASPTARYSTCSLEAVLKDGHQYGRAMDQTRKTCSFVGPSPGAVRKRLTSERMGAIVMRKSPTARPKCNIIPVNAFRALM